jgi:hypothetical protein
LIHTWYANAGKVAEYCECSKPLTIVQGVFIDIASGEKITETFVAIPCLFIFLLLSLFFVSYFLKSISAFISFFFFPSFFSPTSWSQCRHSYCHTIPEDTGLGNPRDDFEWIDSICVFMAQGWSWFGWGARIQWAFGKQSENLVQERA